MIDFILVKGGIFYKQSQFIDLTTVEDGELKKYYAFANLTLLAIEHVVHDDLQKFFP